MVKKIELYPIWAFAIIISSIFSQDKSISGSIIDNETKMPIHGATVFSKNLEIGTSSKVDGSFILKNLSQNELNIEISMIGYKRLNKRVTLKDINNNIGKI